MELCLCVEMVNGVPGDRMLVICVCERALRVCVSAVRVSMALYFKVILSSNLSIYLSTSVFHPLRLCALARSILPYMNLCARVFTLPHLCEGKVLY